ncbi:MAG TPA: alcohol dehydrogenase [Chlamydiales bacterium]|nr:alcohol dehydrogenase [Chlamydiales bacterium]
MKCAQIPGPKQPFQLIEKEIPSPKRGQARVKVQACGVCHSDSFTKEGLFPGIQYPRVPGHEIAGVIDALGEDVSDWKVGQRVGIGWFGGNCQTCEPCRRGKFILCARLQIPGITYDGGYAEYVVVPISALAMIPDKLSPVETGPLMCAGITTFNSLRNSGAVGGDTVAILGIGGLGHLAIQYAAKMGFRTVAIARGKDKQPLALKLGAHHYIDSQSQKVSEELQKLGGAKVILSTVTNSDAVNAVVEGLSIDGKLVVVGVPEAPLAINATPLILKRLSVVGWPSGTSIDCQDTAFFSALTGVRSMNQIFPLEKAADAYDLMMSGKARFRVVLQM